MTQYAEVPPEWFTRALADEARDESIEVAGTAIHYRVWGAGERPAIVLVHGGAAHSHWWDHVAPFLAADRAVVALDLSGHGDSGHRDAYSMEQWADEILAVAATVADSGPPIVIGHSLGGLIVLTLAARSGDQLGGVVIVDSPIGARSPEDGVAADRQAFGPHKVYPELETIMGRFHPIPDQETIPWVVEHVARTSVRQVPGGWSWKFDRRIFDRAARSAPTIAPLACRIAFFIGETGLVTPEMVDRIRVELDDTVPLVSLVASGHHVMLDGPLALVAGLRTLLASWDARY